MRSSTGPLLSLARAGVAWLALASLGCGRETLELFPGGGGAADAATPEASSSGDADLDGRSAGESGGDDACTTDGDCTDPDTPDCDPTLHVCVECIGEPHDCAVAPDAYMAESRCNRITDSCAVPCASNGDCPSGSVCDTSQGVCADCLNDSQCDGSKPRCVAEQCVQCSTNQDCASGAQCWQHACVQCVTNADCGEAGTCSTDHECH